MRNATISTWSCTRRHLPSQVLAVLLLMGSAAHAELSATEEKWVGPMGPNGARAYTVAIDPQNPEILYVAADHIYKSTDGGASWTAKNHGVRASRRVQRIVVDPVDSATLYASTRFGGEIYKSQDGAESWQLLTALGTAAATLAVDPTLPSTLYAAPPGSGVFKSEDAGNTFIPLDAFPEPVTGGLAVDPQSPGTLYVGARDGVAKSTDGGATWVTHHQGLGSDPANLTVCDVALDPTAPSTLYACIVSAEAGGSGYYKSTDGGTTWSQMLYHRWPGRIRVDSSHPATIYASGAGRVFKSVDAGMTWTTSYPGFGVSGVLDVAVDPYDPAKVYVSGFNCCDRSAGVVKSTDGGVTWAEANEGMKFLVNVTVDPLDPNRLYSGQGWGGAYRSTDAGATWERTDKDAAGGRLYASWGLTIAPPATDATHLYSVSSAGFLKSRDRGGSWILSNHGLPSAQRLGPVAVHPLTPNVLYLGAPDGLFQSTDEGDSWSLLSSTLTGIRSLAVDVSDGKMFAGDWGSGLYRSTDGGSQWSLVHPNLWWRGSIAVAGGSVVYAAAYGGLLKSSDGGDTWSGIFSGTVYQTLIDPLDSRILYVATDVGLYRSSDAGATWVEIRGLPDTEIRISSIDFDPQLPSTLFVAYRGIFRITFSPQVFSLAPASGIPGDTVVLVGKNFRPGLDDGTVRFNGVAAPVVSWSDSEIVVQVPQGDTTGPVVVTVLGLDSNADQSFALEYLPVSIDVKPGSFPNTVNLRSHGGVPVAILGSDSFDVNTVDPVTVTLAKAPVRRTGNGTPQASIQDVDGDGHADLVVHVATQALDLSAADTEAVLEGQTFGDVPIRGVDSVRVVP